jgi:protein-S-isoprenylcysteine O-methyltransferase Ste14
MRRLSILGLGLMVVALTGLYYIHSLFWKSPWVIAVQLAAVALMLWARLTLGRRSFHAAADPTEGGLITSGPYRFIRHPIYTAACLFGWAGAAAGGSIASLSLGGLILVGGLLRMLSEEHLLIDKYPAYGEYARATKRMVPYLF